MAIEIYAFRPAPPGALFPSIDSDLKLFAVAPLEKREEVELWCTEKNKEAEEAGVARRFKYTTTAVEIWK